MLQYPTKLSLEDLADVDRFAAAGVLDEFPRLRMLITGVVHQERQRRLRNSNAAEIPREPELTPLRVETWPRGEVLGATLVLLAWIVCSDNRGMREFLSSIVSEIEAEKSQRFLHALRQAQKLGDAK